jgi:hypothetical protein
MSIATIKTLWFLFIRFPRGTAVGNGLVVSYCRSSAVREPKVFGFASSQWSCCTWNCTRSNIAHTIFFLTRTGASFGELGILKAHRVEEAPPFSMAESRKWSRGRKIATTYLVLFECESSFAWSF